MRSVIILAAALAVTACSSAETARTVVVYGDSFSAGAGTNLEDASLWPNKLEKQLDRRGSDWTVSNRSINGNGLVWKTRCFGEPASDRLEADLAKIPNGAPIILMAGVNDVIQPTLPAGFSDCFEPANFQSRDIIARLQALAKATNAHRLLIATLPPFARSELHSARAEAVRQEVNRWIRANWPAENVIDLEATLSTPGDATRLRPDFDSGDGLHPNERGAEAIASTVARAIP